MERSASCLESWQAADLPNVQLSLDEQATEIAAHGQESNHRRRELAGATRAFKSSVGSDLMPSFAQLLKAYQEEVDELTKRAKYGETCFLTIYRVIRELPDPVEELNAANKKVFDAESVVLDAKEQVGDKTREVEKMASELAKCEQELEQLKSNSVLATDEHTLLRTELEDLKAKHEQEVAELSAKAEEQLAGIALELEIAQQEAERQGAELLELREQNSELGSSRSSQVEAEQVINGLKLEVAQSKSKLATLQDECTDVTAQVARLQAENARLRLDESSGAELQSKISELETTVARLTEQLHNAPLPEEHMRLRKQLLVMQSTLFNGTDEAEADDQGEIKLDGLEEWLLKSNKGLKDQVMGLREQLNERDTELNRLRESETKLTDALHHQSELAEQLERDLVSFEGSKRAEAVKSTERSVKQGPTGKQPNEQALQSLLEAVCAQRERLRTSLAKKDTTISNLEKNLRLTTMKLNSLEEDNVDLFKRIKFLQSYKVSERSTLLPGLQSLEEGEAKESRGLGRGVEHKYRQIYESVDNPWVSFQKKELYRAEGSMSFSERLAVRTFNPFLTRRRGRLCLLYYSTMLHIACAYYMFLCMMQSPKPL